MPPKPEVPDFRKPRRAIPKLIAFDAVDACVRTVVSEMDPQDEGINTNDAG